MLEFPPDVSWPNGWTVQVDRLRHGRGRCRWADRTITVDRRLTLPQLRTTLAHEAVHARRGPCPRWLIPREELAVHAQAARALIPIGRLGEALAWSLDPRVVADELEVTPDLRRQTARARPRRVRHPVEPHRTSPAGRCLSCLRPVRPSCYLCASAGGRTTKRRPPTCIGSPP